MQKFNTIRHSMLDAGPVDFPSRRVMQPQLVFGIGSLVCLLATCVNFSSGVPARERIIQHQHPHQHASIRNKQNQQAAACEDPSHRFHQELNQCFVLNDRGPCGENMVIAEDPRNGLAFCTCVDRIGCNHWPFVYSAEANQCFPLYQKGFCNENEWLVAPHQRHHNHNHNAKNGAPNQIQGVCKRRECPHDGRKMIFAYKGSCHEIETRGFCPPGEKLHFIPGSAEPTCGSQTRRLSLCPTPNKNSGTSQDFQGYPQEPDDGLNIPIRPRQGNGHRPSVPTNGVSEEGGQIPVPVRIIPHPGPIIVSRGSDVGGDGRGEPQKIQEFPRIVTVTPSSLTLREPVPVPIPQPLIPLVPGPGQKEQDGGTTTTPHPDQRFLSKSSGQACPDGTKRGPDGRCGTISIF